MFKDANNKLLELAEKFHPHSKYSGNAMQHADDFSSMLQEAGTKGLRHILEHYHDTLPPEHMEDARDFLEYLKEMPTEYFEAKPQRAVGIHEFRGAVVPEDSLEDVKPILDKHGITRIETYGGETEDERKKNRIAALQKFDDHMFAKGGYVKAGDVMHTRNVPKPHTPVVGERQHQSRHPASMIPGIHVVGAIHGIPYFTGKK